MENFLIGIISSLTTISLIGIIVYFSRTWMIIRLKTIYNHNKKLVLKPKSLSNTGDRIYLTEDEIYEKIMLEIEEDEKVKSTWAKALSRSDGDKDKAESIYINLRVEKLNTAKQDQLYFDAKNFVLTEIEIDSLYHPISFLLSKKFKIEHTKAKILEEQLEANGILSAPNTASNRKVLHSNID